MLLPVMLIIAALLLPGPPTTPDAEPAAAAGAPPSGAIGIDVSRWQGTVDWDAVAASGASFAAAKATSGTDRTDPQFAANWPGLAAAGLSRIAYHYPAWSTGPQAQADHLARTVAAAGGLRPGDMLALDLEGSGAPTRAATLAWAEAFMSRLAERTGLPDRRLLVYTSASWWSEHTPAGAATTLGRHPLWVADYGQRPAPRMPDTWASWTLWQHSETGRVAGVSTPVDLDRLAPGLTWEQVTGPASRPGAPRALTLRAGRSGLTLSWQPPAGRVRVTSYQVRAGGLTLRVPGGQLRVALPAAAARTVLSVTSAGADGTGGTARLAATRR